MSLSPDDLDNMIVSELMHRWPQTIAVFMRRRMSCPGCLMASFMTVADAAREYGLAPSVLSRDLFDTIARGDGNGDEI